MKKVFRRKNYRLDIATLRKAQKTLRTQTETETIHRALEIVADEAELAKALRDFLEKGKGHIRDAFARD